MIPDRDISPLGPWAESVLWLGMQIRLRPVEAGEGDVEDGGAEDEPGNGVSPLN